LLRQSGDPTEAPSIISNYTKLCFSPISAAEEEELEEDEPEAEVTNPEMEEKEEEEAGMEDDDSDDEGLFSAPPEDESMSTSAFFDEDNNSNNAPVAASAAMASEAKETPEATEPKMSSGGRKNKRKNFKPRNILSLGGDENANGEDAASAVSAAEGDESAEVAAATGGGDATPLNLSNNGDSAGSPSIMGRKSLLPPPPRKTEAGGAMDLSTTHGEEEEMEENDFTSATPPGSLSVVRPEILFGKKPLEAANPMFSTASPIPFSPFLAPGLAAAMAAMTQGGMGSIGAAPPAVGSDAMKDAFQEVLKLYGVPGEIAAAIARNAQSAQGKEGHVKCISI
jgi:hypothetical protein